MLNLHGVRYCNIKGHGMGPAPPVMPVALDMPFPFDNDVGDMADMVQPTL